MNIAIASLLAAGLMPILWTGAAKVLGNREQRFNNHDTRRWQSGLKGAAARAHAAHLNSFEAFPLFAAAVLVHLIDGRTDSTAENLMVGFVVLRLAYGACYVSDLATLRSLVWISALGCNIALLLLAW